MLGKGNVQTPDPPAVGQPGHRHKTEDEQTHRNSSQPCADSVEQNVYIRV